MFRIAGIVSNRPIELIRLELASMLASMHHDPSDVIQMCAIPELNCVLGWLAEGPEPDGAGDGLVLERNGCMLLFGGEHLGNEGGVRGSGGSHPLSRLLDTGAEGHQALRDLNGWFAGVVVDRPARSLLLFNDRYGLRRFYYAQRPGAFVFASEAKALLAVQPEDPSWDPAAVAEFITCGAVLNDRTLFQGILVLPAGSSWTIKGPDSVAKRCYFSPEEWECQPLLSDDEFYDRLRDTLSRVVPRYLSGVPRAAISLTGGLDTRLIVAFGGAVVEDLPSYTFGGMYRDCYDVRIAKAVAKTCGFRHEVLRISPAFLSDFAHYAEETVNLSDGTLDVSASHELYLNGLARTIAPIRVTGNYGGEVLRNASTFKRTALRGEFLDRGFEPLMSEAATTFDRMRAGHPTSFALFKEVGLHLFGRLNVGRTQLIPRSPYTDNEISRLAYQVPNNARTSPAIWDRLMVDRHASVARIPTDRGRVAAKSSPLAILARTYNYLLFKGEWYYESGMPHWLSRVDRALWRSPRPPFFVGTHKIENYRKWFRDELHDYLHDVFESQRNLEVPGIDWTQARRLLAAHHEGYGNFAREIGKLTTLALIQKLLVSRPQPARPMDVIDTQRTCVVH